MKIENSQLIKKWEELRLTSYLPTPNDKWTIGWGHTGGVRQGMTISIAQAEQYFRSDVAWVEEAVNRLVKVEINQNQFDALSSLVFNIGEPNFSSSTLLRKLNVGDIEGAASEFLKWKYQKGVVLRGLVRRRAEEMEVFLDPSDKFVSGGSIDSPAEMKSLLASKEVVGSVVALVTGAGSFMEVLSDKAQEHLSVTLSVALVGIGLFFLVNRLVARKKGAR